MDEDRSGNSLKLPWTLLLLCIRQLQGSDVSGWKMMTRQCANGPIICLIVVRSRPFCMLRGSCSRGAFQAGQQLKLDRKLSVPACEKLITLFRPPENGAKPPFNQSPSVWLMHGLYMRQKLSTSADRQTLRTQSLRSRGALEPVVEAKISA